LPAPVDVPFIETSGAGKTPLETDPNQVQAQLGIVSSVLRAMQPTAYFVNIARAAIVDYDALLDVMKAGAIAGAALDVYPVEPLPADSPLRTLDNVVLSPHLAGASTDVVRHHSRQIVDDLLRLERGGTPLHVANPGVFDSTFAG
jgi:D-3-phosphoglycerate dehydrogenase